MTLQTDQAFTKVIIRQDDRIMELKVKAYLKIL